MKPSPLNIILKSLLFYRRAVIYQIFIILILSAVITGSLSTGYSVKQSLKITSAGKLGNTALLISSGSRYFDATLSERLNRRTGERAVSIVGITGYCQNFTSGVTALNINIYGISHDFFLFQDQDSIVLDHGTVAINEKLAEHLGISRGDEIIIKFREISPVPAGMPLAPSKETNGSRVLRVGKVLTSAQSGNFSVGISQIVPMNIFINRSDLVSDAADTMKANRLLLENKKSISLSSLKRILKDSLTPKDIGLLLRHDNKSDRSEIISERIFIDQESIEEIVKVIPSAAPVITYLANSISKGNMVNPYSFIAALPSALYPVNENGDHIVINRWLADDLNASVNDTLALRWFVPGTAGKLEERGKTFKVSRVVEMAGVWSDPSLMPEFPGISGSARCSDWDAGLPLKINLIRKKDEAYWNKFKGTPKAFIEYKEGKNLWGNNFGPATAIRFPENMTEEEIESKLTGAFDPEKTGFSLTDPVSEAIRAANESVDFSTLFLSLGIFIILSCIILLSLAVSAFFDSRKDQAATLFALGFTDRRIGQIFLLEAMTIVVTGAATGIFAGLLVNKIIISALNSVWTGAVQTRTLTGHFNIIPLILGFLITLIISLVLTVLKTRKFLKDLNAKDTGMYRGHSRKRNLYFLFLTLISALTLLLLSFFLTDYSILLSFIGGAALFLSAILFGRQLIIKGHNRTLISPGSLSTRFYAFNPSQALTPVIFIAAGIFAVFITGANRLQTSNKSLLPSSGTGGFLLWGGTAIPVKEDLRTNSGRDFFGLNEDRFSEMKVVPAKLLPGDDASCLNLNHISSPPLLGIDPTFFIGNGSFSFASRMQGIDKINPWTIINRPREGNIIYGIADQTVLEWGLKIKTGDTLKLRSENGQPLNIVICAGLKSSIFQGYVLLGEDNFNKFFPSVSGYTVFLISGRKELTDNYQNAVKERFQDFGVSIEPAKERLSSFFEVTNTYLSVFTILGSFGIIIGTLGLGFILIRNYNQRRRDFGLMLASGYPLKKIRKLIVSEQIFILFSGLIAGVFSAIPATLPSIRSGAEVQWIFLVIMIVSVLLTGLIALLLSVRNIKNGALVGTLRKE